MSDSFDLVVIGGGPGGYAAALYGAGAGLDVAVVEKHKLGGTCLHVGCIPAKELLETAAVCRTVASAGEFGINSSAPTVDMSKAQARKHKVVEQLHRGVGKLLENRKVTLVDGWGSVRSSSGTGLTDLTVDVAGGASGEMQLNARYVIVATGSVPRTLAGFEVDGERIMSSDELLSIDKVPERVAIIGGGAIGLEFASMLCDLGSQVTVVEALPQILPGVDADVSKALVRALKKRKIQVRAGVSVDGCSQTKDGVELQVAGGESLLVDAVVVCVGRRPFTEGLDLEPVGVQVDEGGYVVVNDFCQTTNERIYAVGDVVRTPQLAHVAFGEAIMVIKHLLGEPVAPVDYDRVPWAIYCHPEVAYVGYSEAAATDAGFDVTVSTHRYMGNGRAMILGETDGLVKVIAERSADGSGGQILGVHMMGPWVTEQLGQGHLAVNWEATAAEVAEFVQPHPTLSEMFGEAVLSLTGRDLH
ncbi:MAG: dihydrolipoyl dehydrogenase [bacterium]|nr:dihydrolipoyl dehydrogenase [bacterium]